MVHVLVGHGRIHFLRSGLDTALCDCEVAGLGDEMKCEHGMEIGEQAALFLEDLDDDANVVHAGYVACDCCDLMMYGAHQVLLDGRTLCETCRDDDAEEQW